MYIYIYIYAYIYTYVCVYKIIKWLIIIKKCFMIFLYTYIKIVNKYYQRSKEKLQKVAHERYQNLSEEEKEKKQKKGSRQL